jgi:hypothetical protein
MYLPTILFGSFLVFILVVDRIFMPKRARRAWAIMAVTYAFALFFLLFPEVLVGIAGFFGIGRGVDLIIYFLIIIIVRELIMNRSRQSGLERQITLLTREIAISRAQRVRLQAGDELNSERLVDK